MTPHRMIYDSMRARLRGTGDAGAIAGMDIPGLRGVGLPLDGGPLELWLAPGTAAPDQWRCAGVNVPFEAVHAPQWRVQVATAKRAIEPNGFGTVGALVRDRFDDQRYYVLTCGHVLAGTRAVRYRDQAKISVGNVEGIAQLFDWEPTLTDNAVRTGIDAAIARVDDPALLSALQRECMPSGTCDSFVYDQQVVLHSRTPKEGALKTWWSGYVNVPGNDIEADYFLEDAIGYQADPATEGGDSGAAVWDRVTDALLGIHVAAPCNDERWRSNAALCPIARIIDWFDVEPVLRDGAAARLSTLAPPPRVFPAEPGTDSEQLAIVAKTLWGEARGEPERGMYAVACVIERRRQLRWRKAKDAASVCLTPLQFSCWNDNDPNRVRMEAIARQPDAAYERALRIAQDLLDGDLTDITAGATHYYAASMKAPPFWARGKRPCATVGNHFFFNDIG